MVAPNTNSAQIKVLKEKFDAFHEFSTACF